MLTASQMLPLQVARTCNLACGEIGRRASHSVRQQATERCSAEHGSAMNGSATLATVANGCQQLQALSTVVNGWQQLQALT